MAPPSVNLATVPKLLPIAGTWVAPFAAYNFLLSWRIFAMRVKTEQFFGNQITKTSQAKDRSPDSSAPENDPLEMTVRSHSNFLENVPLAFIFLTVCELNGGNRKALSYVMALLFGLRVMHADVGLMLKGEFGSNGVGRPIGFLGSHAVLGGLAGYAGWLVKGYWGL